MRRLLFVCLLLAGCATTGTQIDQGKVETFKPGVTTLAEVESTLGQPNVMQPLPDGGTVLVYVYSHAQIRAASLIPVVGLFAGGSDVNSETVSVFVDAQGKFKSIQRASSQYGAGVGLASGAYQPPK